MYIESPPQKPPSFALSVWQQGSPVATDADPNLTSPPSNRILTLSPKSGAVAVSGQGTIKVIAVGGTSIAYEVYFYDSTLAMWVKAFVARTITMATSPQDSLSLSGTWPGAKFFLRITAVTGVTAFGYDWF